MKKYWMSETPLYWDEQGDTMYRDVWEVLEVDESDPDLSDVKVLAYTLDRGAADLLVSYYSQRQAMFGQLELGE